MALWQPRDYQREALQRTKHFYHKLGINRQLGFAATGLGKTVIALWMPKVFPELAEHGTLFIAHRREILFQAYRKFRKAYPDKWVGIEMGDRHATGLEDIVLMSADTGGREISNRIMKFKRRHFGIVITDEGHHAIEDSVHDNVLTFFGVGSDESTRFNLPNGQPPLSLFLTATPNRNDGKALAPLVDDVSFEYNIQYGVRNGWLCDIRAYQLFDRSGVAGAAYAEDSEIDFLIRLIQDHALGHKTLLFARSVAQSQLLTDTINDLGLLRAGHVDANTPSDERSELIRLYARNELDLMCNRLVFTEGFDDPSITCLIDNGPTNSKPLHIQKLGRGLRPHPDAKVDSYSTSEERLQAIRKSSKPYLTYISTFDPTKHGLDVVASIMGRDQPFDANGRLVVSEVIDRIIQIEEEQPDRPIREIGSLDELEMEIVELDVWNRTVYNDKLKAITPLRWCVDGENTSLYIDHNPFAKDRRYKAAPCVVRYEKNGDGWDFVTIEGGWNGKFPTRNRRVVRGHTKNVSQAIRRLDTYLQRKHKGTFQALQRGSKDPAPDKFKQYMKTNGIAFADGVSEEAASLLIDNYRIQSKLDSVL